jgi:hypothetical protein
MLSYQATRGLKYIYSIHPNYKYIISIYYKNINQRIIIKRSLLIIIVILSIMSPMIIMDLQQPKRGSQNYIKKDIQSTTKFISFLETDDIVLWQAWTNNLLLYAGINPSQMVSDKTLLQELYLISSIEDFSRLIHDEYPNASRVQVFLLKRFMGLSNCPYPSQEFLQDVGEKHELDGVIYYTIPLIS